MINHIPFGLRLCLLSILILGSRECVFCASNLPHGLAIWNFLVKCRSVLLPHLSWVVHNGSKARFWDDSWNGYFPLNSIRDWTPLKSIISVRWGSFLSDYFDIVQSGHVKLAKWKSIDYLNVDLSLKVEFCNVLKNRVVILSKREDELIWTKSVSGKYSVKDGYNSLMLAKDFCSGPLNCSGTQLSFLRHVHLLGLLYKIGFLQG